MGIGLSTIIACIALRIYVVAQNQNWALSHPTVTTCSRVVNGALLVVPVMIILEYIEKPEQINRESFIIAKVTIVIIQALLIGWCYPPVSHGQSDHR